MSDGNEMARKAADRLHHLGMLYVGALAELVRGEPVGLMPAGTPGLHGTRDLICISLLVRAELNALTKLLIDAKVLSADKVVAQFTEEYEWFADQKAKQFGVKLTDYGLTFPADWKGM